MKVCPIIIPTLMEKEKYGQAGGVDITEIMAGAARAAKELSDPRLEQNIAYQYAAIRNLLYGKEKTIEMLIHYEPGLQYFAEWWKQLFGESEGKGHQGIFPTSASFSTDLHSMGQYIITKTVVILII